MNESILKTLAYFDLFDFAPTLLELERWLLNNGEPVSAYALSKTLESLPQVRQTDGYYYLDGRAELIPLRKRKYLAGMRKWKHARKYIRLLAMLPGVEAIWFANSVAWSNAKHGSDIDFVIVTTPGRMWTARFWAAGLMKILKQRPGEQSHDKALCLSLYVDRDHLDMQPYKIAQQDIHYAFWVNQMYPLYDPQHIFTEYQQANSWVENEFEQLHWVTSMPQRRIILGPFGRFVKGILSLVNFEQWAKRYQLHILPERLHSIANTDNRVVINDHILKLHDNDSRKERHTAWEDRVRAIL